MTWKCTNTPKGENKLYSDAKGVVPSLDLRFAEGKNLNDYMTGQQLITFSRSSIGTYVDENGIIQTAIADQPRFDHDPTTGESLGLLIEESRTNLFPYSQEFSLANWSFTGAVPSLNVLNAPDGTLTADKITENLTTGTHQTFKTVAVSNTPYSFSVFAKASGRTQIRMVLFDGASSRSAFFDLLTGATSGELFATALTEEFPNGWWRCVITFTPVATSSAIALIRLVDENGSDSYTGDNTSGVYLWGAQLEEGSFPTSYIPTTGTALTRSADVASITGTNFSSWYNQSEGTVFVDATPVDASVIAIITTFNTYAYFEAHSLIKSDVTASSAGLVISAFNYQANATITNLDLNNTGERFKTAYSYNDDFRASYNGGAIISDTWRNPAPTSLQFGQRDAGTLASRTHIARLTYFPERLPDSSLQTMTTP